MAAKKDFPGEFIDKGDTGPLFGGECGGPRMGDDLDSALTGVLWVDNEFDRDRVPAGPAGLEGDDNGVRA